MVRNEKNHWTSEASNMCDEIRRALIPLYKKREDSGLNREDFFYVASMALHDMILDDTLHIGEFEKEIR